MEPHDGQRIEASVEVRTLNGKPVSEHLAEQAPYTAPLKLHAGALFP
ncbi:hypothetical protein [Neisseria canis]|nr:hypothetical protein [Neisseria canis]